MELVVIFIKDNVRKIFLHIDLAEIFSLDCSYHCMFMIKNKLQNIIIWQMKIIILVSYFHLRCYNKHVLITNLTEQPKRKVKQENFVQCYNLNVFFLVWNWRYLFFPIKYTQKQFSIVLIHVNRDENTYCRPRPKYSQGPISN